MGTTTETKVIDAEIISDVIKDEATEEMKSALCKNANNTLPTYSPEEVKQYTALTKSLNITDINSISNYGSDLQSTMSKYSSTLLDSVKTSKSGEMGTLITGLLSQLGKVDSDDLKEQSAIVKFMRKVPILKNLVSSVEKTMMKYDSIEKNVDEIARKIQATRLVSLRDNKALEVMFENNKQYCFQIEELIKAGEFKLQEVKAKAEEMSENSSQYEPYQIQDANDFANNLDKRIGDMKTLLTVTKQSLMQIRVVQKNNITLADKANSIIGSTIPVWKNQLTLSLALVNQRDNAEAITKVSDATNDILRKNADMLKINSIEVARENERSVISVETLQKTTQDLIDTIREVQQIHREGAMQRIEAERELANLGNQLNANMLEAESHLNLLENKE